MRRVSFVPTVENQKRNSATNQNRAGSGKRILMGPTNRLDLEGKIQMRKNRYEERRANVREGEKEEGKMPERIFICVWSTRPFKQE